MNGISYISGISNYVCNEKMHQTIISLSAIGLALFVPYGLLMSLLFFESNPKHLAAKVSGKMDCIYMVSRIGLVVTNTFLPPKPASILDFLAIGFITCSFLWNQPFFAPKLNDIRFAFYFSAFIISVCAMTATFGEHVGLPYVISALVIGIVAIPIGYYINHYVVKIICADIYRKLDHEATIGSVPPSHSQSFLELNDVKITDVLNIRKQSHKVKVFPAPQWVEISIRFIRKSYLSHRAASYASNLFNAGFQQFPRNAFLHILRLEYIDCYFPGEQEEKVRYMNVLKTKCTKSLSQKVHIFSVHISFTCINLLALWNNP
jgi:hypothetical protein